MYVCVCVCVCVCVWVCVCACVYTFTLVVSWKTCYMWCANEIMRYATPRLNYHKCLSIKLLELGDVISILLPLVTSIAIWGVTRPSFCVVLSFLLPFYFSLCKKLCDNFLILNGKNMLRSRLRKNVCKWKSRRIEVQIKEPSNVMKNCCRQHIRHVARSF